MKSFLKIFEELKFQMVNVKTAIHIHEDHGPPLYLIRDNRSSWRKKYERLIKDEVDRLNTWEI